MPVSTREERRQQRKYERQAAQRKAERSAVVRRNAVVIAGIVLVIVVAALIVILAGRQGSASPTVTGPGTHFDDPVTASGGLYQHVPDTQPIQYDHYPPNHGNHYDTPRPWGAYDSPVPDGYFLHNEEHGGVIVLYNCPNGCADVAAQLKNLPTTLPKEPRFGEVKVIVSPYTRTDHLITLVAWDWQEDLDSYDFDAIKAFYQAHVDKGPEQIP